MSDKKHIFQLTLEKGGRKSTFFVSRLKTAVVVPLQELIMDYSDTETKMETDEFIARACDLVALAINDKNVTAKDVEQNSSLEELMMALMAMRIWCMAILGGESNPKAIGVQPNEK